ncbi:GNAT family N-acetyltransferase [Paenibacillus chartarius]|uniref:GNAT family N-acetyltransferase n=1 Tax=Paenibacillus chartarius TaxID=747481 RepID=A0ABV6DSZ7_9BACL
MKLILQAITAEDTVERLGLQENSEAAMVLEHQRVYYHQIGFNPPWISYFANGDGNICGVCSFKGSPHNGRVELAYFTFPGYEAKGIGTLMCKRLCEIAGKEDPKLMLTARTLPHFNASTSILKKNGFICSGTVQDPDDGEVWEWVRSNS